MCSINGFNFRSEPLIRKMVSATQHRGPDQEGLYFDDCVSLGHARLSIIDLSEKGRQPIWNEDGSVCVICNGEIYNFQELRRDLKSKGHRFFSSSDSEVILHLYEEEGPRCLKKLNGIFAFAIYDKPARKLFLARDRVGVKPLYYYFNNGKFIFSSEIKAILAHPLKRELDQEAFQHHFRLFFTPAPFTLFKGVRKLPPAHFLVAREGRVEIKKYWDLKDQPERTNLQETIAAVKNLFQDSVKRQLISDRPVGIFLSGGIDSSSVLGAVAEVASGRIKTYSVGFDIDVEVEKYNRDYRLARQTSQYYGTDHHELLVSGKDVRDNLEKVIWHMEEPVPNPTQTPTFLLAKLAKKEVAVVLGGDGGDEIFGGYPRYYNSKLIDRYQLLPSFLKRNILPCFLEKIFKKKDLKMKLNIPQGVERYFLHMGQKDKTLLPVLKTRSRQDSTFDFLKGLYPEDRFKDPLKYLMYLDLMTWLPDESLLRSDKMTMAFGLEERVPILDHRIVELGFQIPTKYKVRGKKTNKWIFREAMKGYLPPHLLDKGKRGWFSPAAKWLRRELKEMVYEVLSPTYTPLTKELFDFQQIKTMLDNHISQKEYNLDPIWCLFCFQIWYKIFIEGKPR